MLADVVDEFTVHVANQRNGTVGHSSALHGLSQGQYKAIDLLHARKLP
jgi:hypothetical protein